MTSCEDGAALLAQQRLGQRQQRVEAGVAALVDGVPEAGQPSALAQHVVQRARHAVALGHDQQLVGLLAGTAVQRAGQRGQPGQQRVVGVGAHRGRHAHGHRRGGELVVRHEDEGGVDGGRGHRRGRAARGGAVSRAAMEASGLSPRGAGPTTSVSAAVARRAARATAAGAGRSGADRWRRT